MKQVSIHSVLQKLKMLEESKQEKIDQIVRQTKLPFAEDVKLPYTMQFIEELKEIQDQIEELHLLPVSVPDDFKLKL